MAHKKITSLVLLSSLMAFSGCAGMSFSSHGVPFGSLYVDSSNVEQISDQSGNNYAKTGEACAISILGLVVMGEADSKTAAANGGITDVAIIDNRYKNFLGVYAEYCVVVHGTGSDKASK